MRPALALALLLACRAEPDAPAPRPAVADPTRCEAVAPPREPALRRLTRDEYVSAVRDLFGVAVDAASLPADERVDGVAGVESGWSSLDVERYADAAALVSAQTPAALACADCVTVWVRGVAGAAFRRRVGDDEVAQLAALHDAPDGGPRAVIEALLVSPYFLLREAGGAAGERTATRMSFFLWGAAPDAALREAAARGELDTAAGVEARARLMLRDARARDGVGRLAVEWLGVGDLASSRLDAREGVVLDAALVASMKGDVARLAASVTFDLDGRLSTLLRAGLLTERAVLTRYASTTGASAVARGRFVRERILCQTLPPPPPGLTVTLPASVAGESARARLARHATDAACAGCHRLMDPLGFAFEGFDATGRARSGAFDARGSVTDTVDADGAFEGAAGLASRLAASRQVRDCAVTWWARYAAGRALTRGEDCALDAVRARFEASGGDLRELAVALASSPLVRGATP